MVLDPDRRRFLEEVAAACERVVAARSPRPVEPHHAAVFDGLGRLLAQLRRELDGEEALAGDA